MSGKIFISKVQNEYKLMIAHNTNQQLLVSGIHNNIRLAFVLLILMIGATVITMCSFVCFIVLAAKREMYLCGALINQMEATQQSERKSMNKSLAFASASHDIRASLAGITGLTEICCHQVTKKEPLRSELMLTNLQQMEACTRDLLGILNSILDTSKIEAGKMQLEEVEFDIEQLLEDVVDLYHPVGMKKGVDVILDPHDGSVMKSTCVKGDRGKLKQILSNLLSNAVKFTSEGHVTVRACARKPRSLRNASNRNNSISCLFCWLFKNESAYSESEVVSSNSQRDMSRRTEYVFEVNDTGKGIPKEKQKSVFENYVQVKETAVGQEGTGLGLGIVQSLVRLMGGEIGIVDKEIGERGTCFRFNVFFSTCEPVSTNDIEANNNGDYISEPIIRIHTIPKTERSQVLLFIQSAERSKVVQNFMQRLGIKVHVVKQHEQLSAALKKIKRKLSLSHHSSSGKSDGNSRSDERASSTRSKEVPLSSLDGVDDILPSPSQKKPNARLFGLVLIVIDTRAGPFRDISRAVAEFRRDLNDNCYSRVVWLDKPDTSNSNFHGLGEDKLPPSDLVISKPFHGSRLYRIIALLPEFGGTQPTRGENVENVQPRNVGSLKTSTSYVASKKSGVNGKSYMYQKSEIEEVGGPNNKKPLTGKKILVADDDPIGRKIATFVASQLGANIFHCENGEEAWKLVCKSLEDGTNIDCILMDCEMPVMDGIEATSRIREAEEIYGVHTPIIALTAHYMGEDIDKMIEAGVDAYLTKPLNKEFFLKAISELTIMRYMIEMLTH
ncbi:hypothetical protein DH2020_043372 [Rehmannia glutinosa]|uniref:histidine kinase n=1 Tax=Rehmannia glutinosa TaxID=99300 RepID=A0ABR0ULK8_REHGL